MARCSVRGLDHMMVETQGEVPSSEDVPTGVPRPPGKTWEGAGRSAVSFTLRLPHAGLVKTPTRSPFSSASIPRKFYFYLLFFKNQSSYLLNY